MARAPRRIDHTGKRFGSLVAVHAERVGHRVKWSCLCDCGQTTDVFASALTSGRTTRCWPCSRKAQGLSITTHGESRSRLYKVWADMVNRCKNNNLANFKYYGGKGVSVCDEWQTFAGFQVWAKASGYTDSMTIDRLDTEGNYSPENCQWVSRSDNSRRSALARHARASA